MRRLIILSTIALLCFGCKVNEKPIFVSVENIDVIDSNSQNLVLSADAQFLNPNDIGGELKTDEIEIIVNGNAVGYVSTKSFKVPANKEFSIPLTAKVPLDSLISNKSIGGLINSIFSKKIEVQYKGDIVYKALGMSYRYAVDETQEIKIKL